MERHQEVSIALVELVKAPVTAAELRQRTQQDPVVGTVLESIGGQFALDVEEPEHFRPYKSRAAELTTEAGCMLELHEVHAGMRRMEALARSYVWWPSLDADIEKMMRRCAYGS